MPPRSAPLAAKIGARATPESQPCDEPMATVVSHADGTGRHRTHRDCLYVFLHRDDVEPTNNGSERDLRPSVIHRKVIGGFRSAWGAEASAIRTAILATARKQGRNILGAFRAI